MNKEARDARLKWVIENYSNMLYKVCFVILKNEEGVVTSFLEKPTWETAASFLINTGIYFLKGDLLDLIPENTFCDFSDQLFPEILRQHKTFMCYETAGLWGDMGEFGAYRALSNVMLKNFTDDFLYSGALYTEDREDERGNLFIAPCLVGKNAVLGANNRIGPGAVVGSGLVMGSGCTVKNSVLGENVKISDGTDVLGAVLDDAVTVGDSCVIEEDAVLGYGAVIGRFTSVLSGNKIWPGRSIAAESVITRDMFYETPESIEPDSYGVSGKAYAQFSLTDAVRLGQALASVKGVKRVGIGCDREKTSDVYKSVCAGGIRACGVICYDFDEIFKTQAFFYGAYCDLDAFVFISCADSTVNFSFYGKNGMPVTAKTARELRNHFRFASFRFCDDAPPQELFKTHLLHVAYSAALQKTVAGGIKGMRLRFECENPLIRKLSSELIEKLGAVDAPGGIQFLVNENATDMYCLENDRFYDAQRLKTVLCELAFAEGKDVVIGEDMPALIEEKAAQYGRRAYRLIDQTSDFALPPRTLLENIWNFDALFLCFKLLSVLSQANVTLEELSSLEGGFALRGRVLELNCGPARVRRLIEGAGAAKKQSDTPYFVYDGKKGTAKIRQLGNTSRIKILVEAANAEAAKELSGDICAKFQQGDIIKN